MKWGQTNDFVVRLAHVAFSFGSDLLRGRSRCGLQFGLMDLAKRQGVDFFGDGVTPCAGIDDP